MASQGLAATGTILTVNNYPILELTRISPPIGDIDFIDITNHDSPDMSEEVVPGIIRIGEITVEGNFLPTDTTGQVQLISDLQSQTMRAIGVHLPGGRGSLHFNGYIKNFNVDLPTAGKADMKMSIRPSGKSNFYTTTSTGLTTPYFNIRDNNEDPETTVPNASGSVYWYTCTIDEDNTAFAVQPFATAGTIRINGTTITSGNWTSDISISSGTWKLIIIAVAESGKATKTYRIWVNRP